MPVKLTCHNFFTNYIINCNAKELGKDRKKALIRSIALGVFFAGIPHIVCSIALKCRSIKHIKSTEVGLTSQRNVNWNPLLLKAVEQCQLNALEVVPPYGARDPLLDLGIFMMPIDKNKALQIFELAKQKENADPKHIERSLAMANIAISNSKEKLRIANSLENGDQMFALRQVAIDLAKDNIKESLKIVDQLGEDSEQFYALVGIIKIVTPQDLELGRKLANRAAELALSMHNNRTEIEIIIDTFFAKYDRERAFELADVIESTEMDAVMEREEKQAAFNSIGKEYAKSDLQGALKWAKSLKDYHKVGVFCSMIEGISSIHPQLSKALMREVLSLRVPENEDRFEEEKIIYIRTMALVDLDEALKLLETVKGHKVDALLGIVQMLMPANPKAALEVAPRLFEEALLKNNPPSYRSHIFMELAKVIFEGLQRPL